MPFGQREVAALSYRPCTETPKPSNLRRIASLSEPPGSTADPVKDSRGAIQTLFWDILLLVAVSPRYAVPLLNFNPPITQTNFRSNFARASMRARYDIMVAPARSISMLLAPVAWAGRTPSVIAMTAIKASVRRSNASRHFLFFTFSRFTGVEDDRYRAVVDEINFHRGAELACLDFNTANPCEREKMLVETAGFGGRGGFGE